MKEYANLTKKINDLGDKFFETRSHEDFKNLYEFYKPVGKNVLNKRFYNIPNDEKDIIIHNTLIQIFNSIDYFDRSKGIFSTYLYNSLLNASYGYWRSKLNTISIDKNEYLTLKDESFLDFEEKNEVEFNLKRMYSALDKLEEPFKSYIEEFYLKNYSLKDISAKYNENINTVKTKLRKGLSILRSLMKVKDKPFKKISPNLYKIRHIKTRRRASIIKKIEKQNETGSKNKK